MTIRVPLSRRAAAGQGLSLAVGLVGSLLVTAGSAPPASAAPSPSDHAATASSGASTNEGDDEEQPFGVYLLAHGALLGSAGPDPTGFDATHGTVGGDVGLRLGLRVADWAGLDLGVALTSVRGSGEARYEAPSGLGPMVLDHSSYMLRSVRLGGNLRLLAPGRTTIRAVGSIGGGLAVEQLLWSLSDNPADARFEYAPYGLEPQLPSPRNLPAVTGVMGGFGELDLGFEFELRRAIFGLTLEGILQTTSAFDFDKYLGHLAGHLTYSPFDDRMVFFIGPALHVGVGLW